MHNLSPIVPNDFIYLDYNATTPCAPEVVAAMIPYLDRDFGNPASMHRIGRVASKAVEEARAIIAQTIDCSLSEIVFTSGATEANNIVLLGLPRTSSKRNRI